LATNWSGDRGFPWLYAAISVGGLIAIVAIGLAWAYFVLSRYPGQPFFPWYPFGFFWIWPLGFFIFFFVAKAFWWGGWVGGEAIGLEPLTPSESSLRGMQEERSRKTSSSRCERIWSSGESR